MDNDKKGKVVKYLKIMTAYFGLYIIHYIILPYFFKYGVPESASYIKVFMLLLFPLFDILILKSNILYGSVGICLYSFCVYIYNAKNAYDFSLGGFIGLGVYKEPYVLSDIEESIYVYIVYYFIIYIIVFIIRKIREYLRKKEEERWNS